MDLSGNVRNIISAALKRFLQRDNSHKNYICMSGFVCISLIIYTSLLFLVHSEEKGCGLSSFECEDEGVYTDVNDRSPNHEERAQDAPLSSLWRAGSRCVRTLSALSMATFVSSKVISLILLPPFILK